MRNLQNRSPVQLKPDTATVRIDAFHLPIDNSEASTAQFLRGDDWRLPPEPTASRTRLSLHAPVAADQLRVWRDGDEERKTFGQEERFEIVVMVVIHMGQDTTVMVFRLWTWTQPHLPVASTDQRLKPEPSCLSEGFRATSLAPDLRGIQTDETNTAAVGQAQRIAIDDLRHLYARQCTADWAKRLRGKTDEYGNEKGAHQGRLFQMLGKPHGFPSRQQLTWRRTHRNAA